MPAPTSPTELLDLVRKSGVLTDDIVDRLANGPPLPESPPKLAAQLVKQGLLTTFQAKLLLAGRHRGFKLGPYIVREHIAQGGMGAVYLAEHESLKRRVALKVLTADKDPLAVKRFAREARSAAALDHPNIVRMFDVAAQGQVQYLVMEYVDGQTLETMLAKSGRVPFARLADWMGQVACGLQHALEKGFVHRDIKPANLMVDKAGQAKVLDMGLARSDSAGDKLTEMMDKGAVVGTADYISPEQAMSGQCDIRADIYSLGATFYTLAAGHPPFQGTTSQKLIAHQMTTAPSLAEVVPGFPPGLAAVVAKMMAKKPADRYQTPAEVAAALSTWATGNDSSSVEIGTAASESPGASTKRLNHPAARTTTARPLSSRHPRPAPSSPAKLAKARTELAAAAPRPAAGWPAWAVILAAGAGGFAVVGVAGAALYALMGPNAAPATAPPVAEPRTPAAANRPAPTPVPAALKSKIAAETKAAKEAADLGRWQESADHYLAAGRDEPDSYDHPVYAATLLAMAGNDAEYQRCRQELLARFAADPDPRVRERVAKACLLRPGTDAETATCARMAETSLRDRDPSFPAYAYHEMAVALAEYRQGKFAEADKRLTGILAGRKPSVGLTTTSLAIQALARQRLGQSAAAKESLVAAVDQASTLAPDGVLTPKLAWQDWVVYEILRREADGR